MKVQYTKNINNNKVNLTINKSYDVIDTRWWNNGVVQYFVEDDTQNKCWFSKKRFSNRKEKLQKINESSLST